MYTDTVDESMDMTDHMGDSSMMNQSAAIGGSHTRALLMTWAFVVAVWWGLRFLFKGQLS